MGGPSVPDTPDPQENDELKINNLKKYHKYKTKYLQIKNLKGGAKQWTNKAAENKASQLQESLGKPTHTCSHKKGNEYVMWASDLSKKDFKYGKFNGVDMIKVTNYSPTKLHPYQAPVFVIVGKYVNVPDALVGLCKYASPTINIEHLAVPISDNEHYIKNGKKRKSLVTGSCASVTISVITINFVMDMIKEHGDLSFDDVSEELSKKFRDEYNTRIQAYLCGEGIKPPINWFSPSDFGELEVIKPNVPNC